MEINEKNKVKEFLTESNKIEQVGIEGYNASFDAFNYAMGLKKIDKKTVLKIHKILLKTLNPRIAGKFRKCNVMVGGRICPNAKDSQRLLKEFYKLVNSKKLNKTNKEKENFSKTTHIAFEHAHPFEDGNGRVGRILYAWHRIQMDLKMNIINYNDRWEYYDWFK